MASDIWAGMASYQHRRWDTVSWDSGLYATEEAGFRSCCGTGTHSSASFSRLSSVQEHSRCSKGGNRDSKNYKNASSFRTPQTPGPLHAQKPLWQRTQSQPDNPGEPETAIKPTQEMTEFLYKLGQFYTTPTFPLVWGKKEKWKTNFPDTKHRSSVLPDWSGEEVKILLFIKRLWLFVGWLAKERVENPVWALFIPDFNIPWNPKNKDW